ncbi:MAG: type I secretion system permease/ATPase [Gammaproteobacteria bacterium]|nr:type I secretion system permease/ATPase [Gammaproteobacteria bacterium]MBU1655115.1 type I secretion system permease/ATPase [Gammaproteobacteria bacterium]MBU1961587.1 type I secretion system permease/ATPase [Gammaproteobacteria bacterium]
MECLVALTKLQHKPFSTDALKAGLPLVDNKLTPTLFVRAADRAGLAARIMKRPLEEISSFVLPAVLLLKKNQATILLKVNHKQNMAVVIHPASGMGEKTLRLDKLKRAYSGVAIFVQPQFRYDDRAPSLISGVGRHWFWSVLGDSWKIYRDVLVASLLINLFALASPLFMRNVYDRVVPNNAEETLWVLAIGVSIVYGFDILMRLLRGYFIDVAGKKTDIRVSAAIFERVMGLKMESRPASVGAFANNLREFESVRDFITSATIATLIDLPFILIFIVVIALIAGPLALVPIIAVPLILLYGLMVQKPLRQAAENTYRASAQKNATLIESLSGMETIKFLGAEGPLQRKWEKSVAHIASWGAHSRLISSSTVNFAVAVQQLASVAIIVGGVYLIIAGDLSMGSLIAVTLLNGRAMAPMGQVANLSTRYFQARTALDSLNRIMQMPVERPEGVSFLSRPELKGNIEFDDVAFKYPNQENACLRKISFRIAAGERVGVIGRIGSGKTTINKLIQGMYHAQEGAVRIDGTDIRQIDPADVRRNIGYVPQDIVLFYGSVRDNITYGAPYVDDKSILQAAKLAGVSNFVDYHPLGFDMPVGERGELLSGGQRQAIAVARALLLDPNILLLDEPSNSMDNTSEEIVRGNLRKVMEGKTVIIVTHRASLLDLVDRLIVVDNGRLVADGPKQKVLEALRDGRIGMG